MSISLTEELNIYLKIKASLLRVPNNYRSQNFTAYFNEIESRIYEINGHMKYIAELDNLEI